VLRKKEKKKLHQKEERKVKEEKKERKDNEGELYFCLLELGPG